MANVSRNQARVKKHWRTRVKLVAGTTIKPRLNVFKSLRNFEAQLIDDTKGKTLIHVSTIKDKSQRGNNILAAQKVGTEMGKKMKEIGIKEIVFDRGGYVYHGRVKAFADAVRAEGVKF